MTQQQLVAPHKILVTGASGFVGRFLCEAFSQRGVSLRAAVRKEVAFQLPLDVMVMGNMAANTDWSQALKQVSVVVHLAARVHVMNDLAPDPLMAFRQVNVEGTLNLARQAASMGVSRFIYLSSIKVNGEYTAPNHPFTAHDAPNPQDPYSVSKAEAEAGLRRLSEQSGMEVVIIRPPLVYGPGVKANFLTMLKWVNRRVPLPFGAIHNSRSLVGIDNLVDLIMTCVTHPAAANKTFLVSDNQDVSTTQLLKLIGQALGKPALLIPIPMHWMQLLFNRIGRRDLGLRLFGSLQVDVALTQQTLGWTPPVSLEAGLKQTTNAI